ncbi:hypothetical protein VCHA34P112_10247 [Vibrio chagasii]|nr:hypothetical protein VCHA34P112_10247 [Vibrio chagasii]CAH7052640.1 hypothetical protein VCHA56P515_10130 [Vibrio chagasii]CAH7106272.1 hypothetical protein VCHA53O463_10130 [Vibrio chagasii]
MLCILMFIVSVRTSKSIKLTYKIFWLLGQQDAYHLHRVKTNC